MTYTYRASGLAPHYSRYVEALLNRFTESGLQIVKRFLGPSKAEVKVKYENEVGFITVQLQGDDIIVSFNVRETLEKKGLEIARTGIRFLGTIITGGSPVDATIYTIEDSFNAALSGDRGYLASVIASAVRDVAENLKYKIEEEMRETGYRREEFETRLTSIKSRLLTISEEIEFAKEEGKDVSRIEKRYQRAEELCEEAVVDAKAGKHVDALAKLEAASRLLDRAEEMLSSI